MKPFANGAIKRAILGLAVLWPAAVASSLAAQELRNPQIETVYVEPGDPAFRPIYERLKKRHVLEDLNAFLSPLLLPRKLIIKLDQCGVPTVPYKPEEGIVTICYEYVDKLDRLAPADVVLMGPVAPPDAGVRTGYLYRDDALVGAFVQLALTQVAYAVFDIFNLPIWGRDEFAADNVAGFIMLNFGKDIAWRTLIGTAWFMAQSGSTGIGAFYSVRSPEAQRFFNYLCLAYASDRALFEFLVTNNTLPKDRADFCVQDYEKLRYSIDATIMPHVDRDLLKKVNALVRAGELLKRDDGN